MIVPVFGDAYRAFLREAVASVEAQTYVNWEIVVASDEPMDIESDRIRVLAGVASADRGVCDARNRAIEAARSDLIVSLDADDLLDAKYLRRAVSALPETKYAIVATDLQEFGARSNLWRIPPSHLVLEHNVFPMTTLFTRATWEAAGGYDEGVLNFGDWDFWVRCITRAQPRVVVLHAPLVRYRIHESNAAALYASDATHPLSELWKAALQLRHAGWYDDSVLKKARATIRRMPEEHRKRVAQRLSVFPENEGLRTLAALAL